MGGWATFTTSSFGPLIDWLRENDGYIPMRAIQRKQKLLLREGAHATVEGERYNVKLSDRAALGHRAGATEPAEPDHAYAKHDWRDCERQATRLRWRLERPPPERSGGAS